MIDKPFKVGDYVELGNNIKGRVIEISLRYVKIRTKENYIQIIPTSEIMETHITNRNILDIIKVFLEFGLAYDADIDKARQVILDVFKGDERIADDPPATVTIKQLADSCMLVRVRFSIKRPHQIYVIRSEYNEKIRKALAASGVEIAYPTTTVYLKNEMVD